MEDRTSRIRRALRGSSPRGRGTRLQGLASAAKTLRDGSSPRGRGTHAQTAARPPPNLPRGSSPRGRGTLTGGSFAVIRLTVHPRAGGERLNATCLLGYASGSSPRGRGTPGRCLPTRVRPASHRSQYCLYRFIPARAGNASLPLRMLHGLSGSSPRGGESHRWCRPAMGCWWVHPRAGGERELERATPTRSEHRFIPARAGNATHRSHGVAGPEPSGSIPARAGNAVHGSDAII